MNRTTSMLRFLVSLSILLLTIATTSVVDAMAMKRILVTGGNKGTSLVIFISTSVVCRQYILTCLLTLFATTNTNITGIGKAICQKLVADHNDVTVLMGARDQQRGHDAIQDIVQQVGGDCQDRLQLVVLDTSSDASVKDAASRMEGELYGIINNAGVSIAQ